MRSRGAGPRSLACPAGAEPSARSLDHKKRSNNSARAARGWSCDNEVSRLSEPRNAAFLATPDGAAVQSSPSRVVSSPRYQEIPPPRGTESSSKPAPLTKLPTPASIPDSSRRGRSAQKAREEACKRLRGRASDGRQDEQRVSGRRAGGYEEYGGGNTGAIFQNPARTLNGTGNKPLRCRCASYWQRRGSSMGMVHEICGRGAQGARGIKGGGAGRSVGAGARRGARRGRWHTANPRSKGVEWRRRRRWGVGSLGFDLWWRWRRIYDSAILQAQYEARRRGCASSRRMVLGAVRWPAQWRAVIMMLGVESTATTKGCWLEMFQGGRGGAQQAVALRGGVINEAGPDGGQALWWQEGKAPDWETSASGTRKEWHKRRICRRSHGRIQKAAKTRRKECQIKDSEETIPDFEKLAKWGIGKDRMI
ncbi:hypothetical protein C8J57DRAFT_1254040 [Mycena rebaudengoi]|nr:hypothetical protein C8J57DRAFT_1254040 [Mycena rebaudengoi]